MEVFLVYKQFCNIKDVLSKPYDQLTYEDQLKMYDPLLFSLDEILEYEMEDDAQEGGGKFGDAKKMMKAAKKVAKAEKSDPGFGADEKETAATGFKKMLQNLLKIIVIILLIVAIPLFPWIAIIYYTWGRFRTLYIRVIEPM